MYVVRIKWRIQRYGLSPIYKHHKAITCPPSKNIEYSNCGDRLSFLLGIKDGRYESFIDDEMGFPKHQPYKGRKGKGSLTLWNEKNKIVIYQPVHISALGISGILMWCSDCSWPSLICQF